MVTISRRGRVLQLLRAPTSAVFLVLLLGPGAAPGPATDHCAGIVPVICSASEAIYYYPDNVGKDATGIAGHAQALVRASIEPVLGRPVNVRYFNRLEDLEAQLECCRQRGQYPLFAVMHAEVALENRERWGLELFAYPILRSGEPTHTISVVVRKDSPVQHLEDLRGRTVLAPEYWGRQVTRFERLVFAGRLRLTDLAEVKLAPSSISAVVGAHYRQADAALVSSRVFHVLQERTVAVWRSMRAIHESQPLLAGALVFFATTGEDERQAIRREVLKVHEKPEGRAYFEYVHALRAEGVDWGKAFSAQDLEETATAP